MELGLICVLLLTHYAQAVVNKAPEQQEALIQDDDDLQAAEDRISNVYGAPPGPVYGPPEITGDYRPPQVYAPPPPENPPPPPPGPVYGPPPRKSPQLFLGPKPTYGAPVPGPPKSNYGPPKPRYGPPKLQHGRPSFGSFRPPKPKYGPPFNSGPGFAKPGHGPPIPISVEAYGPPVPSGPASFNVPSSAPQGQYGPPPMPHKEYGPPKNQYGPPLQQQKYVPTLPSIPAPPPPGVPAPPTPPDIKYDGWQPISGNVNLQKLNGQVSDSYGPPANTYGPPADTYGPPEQSHGPPADTYGPPSPSTEHDPLFLPPNTNQAPPAENYGPPSPVYVTPANNYGPPDNNHGSVNSGEHESLSAFPATNLGITSNSGKSSVPNDSYGVPLHSPEAQNLKSSIHESSVSPDSDGLPPQPLPQLEPFHVGKGPGDTDFKPHTTYGVPNGNDLTGPQKVEALPNSEALVGQNLQISGSSFEHHDDLALQQLPQFPPAQFTQSQQSLSPPSQRPFNAYGPPVSQSYGPPPQGHGNRGPPPSFHGGSQFGKLGGSFTGKSHGSLRPPPATLVEQFTPPRPRAPLRFKDQIPANVFSSLNRYLPPAPTGNFNNKPQKNYGPPLSTEPQLPNLSPPVNFHNSQSSSNGASFATSHSSIEHHTNLSPPVLAAPNVNYGTPLSFGSFNTPSPLLNYGAPNFGPVTPLVPDNLKTFGSLYNTVSNALPLTYGTPVIGGHNVANCIPFDDAKFNFGVGSGNFVNSHQGFLDGQSHFANVGQPSGLYQTPTVNELELQVNEQQKSNLKDSYGNPIGISFDDSDQASANVHVAASNNVQQQLEPSNSLTSQSEGKNIGLSELDAMQFLNSAEGQQAIALAEGSDGFQIQGSRGLYTLQIQPADGGLGTENSDGSIKHEQVLSNGLLQDILAAIEQPQHDGHIQLQGLSNSQPIEPAYSVDLHHAASSAIVSQEHANYKSQAKKDVDSQTGNSNAPFSLDKDKIALFVNNDYSESRQEKVNESMQASSKKTEGNKPY